jgi:putative tryptophan/tyrosine transport system substrate-binding protein
MRSIQLGRREFITLLGGAAGLPLAARAQLADRMRRVGVLGNTSESAEDLRQALRELGWIEGQNVTFEWRWAAGRLDHLPELAAELVRLPVDLIITITHRVALVAKETTTTIPIVFTRVNDPVGVGLVPSLARPGSNLTGISLQGLDLIGIRLQLLQEAATQFARVAYLTDPTEPYSPRYLLEVQTAAKTLGLTQVLPLEVSAAEEFANAFAELARQHPDGLLLEPNSLNLAHRDRIADSILEQRLPSIDGERRFMGANGLMSYGPNISDHFRDAAVYVDKILRGAKPSDLPVEQPTRFELVINLKTARRLGLTISPPLLARASEVIE